MKNYKGMFFNKEKEKKYYEAGAHFKYSDLVNALNILLNEAKDNNIINSSKNPNIKKEYHIVIKNKYLKTEQNNNKNDLFTEKKINSNLLTINNDKNIFFNKRKPQLSIGKNIYNLSKKKIQLLDSPNDIYKIPPKLNINNEYSSINSYERGIRSKSIFANKHNTNKLNNNNFKLMINKNSFGKNLPLIESVYFNKLLIKDEFGNIKNKNYSININKINKNEINKNNLPSPKDFNYNYRKSFFPFKSNDNNKNNKNFDTINIFTRRRNYNLGKLFKDLKIDKNKKII